MKFLSSKGFSLVEIMIAIGLVGIAGVAVMTLTESSNKEAKWGEMAFVKSEFVGALGKYLVSSRGCDDLRGCDYGEICSDPAVLPAISENQDIVLKWKVAGIEGNPDLEMKKGREFKLFKVSELKIESIDKSGSNTRIGTHEGQKGFVNVKLTLQIKASLNRKDVSAPNRNYSYQFKVPAVIDASDKILGCFESQSLQESCEAIGGNSDSGTCKQDRVCRIVSSCYEKKTTDESTPPNPNPFPPYPPPPPDLNICDSNSCPGDLFATGGESKWSYLPQNCLAGSKTPCNAANTSYYLIKSCMVCSNSSSTGGSGSTTSGSTTSGSVSGGSLYGGAGFGSGSGSI